MANYINTNIQSPRQYHEGLEYGKHGRLCLDQGFTSFEDRTTIIIKLVAI